MNNSFKVIGVTVVDAPARDGKSQHLAQFTCEIADIVRLAGCTLLRFHTGQIRSFPPTTDKRRDGESFVRVLDEDTRRRITDAAYRAYKALGGVE